MTRPIGVSVVLGLLVTLHLSAVPCLGQNLLVNGGFDTDLSSWTPSGGTVSWDPNDADGSPSSGSAYIINDLPTNTSAGLNQCVQVQENLRYEFGGEFFIVPGSPTTVNADVLIYTYPNTTCSGAPLGSQGTGWVPTLGAWTTVSALLDVPATGASAHVRIRVAKTTGGVDVFAYVDNVVVALDAIFSDGFESSDTSAWSSTVP